MRLDRIRRLGRGLLPLTAALLCLVASAPADLATPEPAPDRKSRGKKNKGEEDDAAKALRLYDAGDYAGALPLLEKLHESGDADGATLYRLYYARLETGAADAAEVLPAAMELLEKEVSGKRSGSLEAAFYLANGYGNIAKHSERARVAELAVKRIEDGKWSRPETAVDMFRLGKLYQDLERAEGATTWYREAVAALDTKRPAEATYARYAHRYLADQARASGDDAALLEHSVALIDDPGSSQQQLDELAVQLVRALRYQDAAKAWAQAVLRSPATANRARYANRVAISASALAPLPLEAPDGRTWAELSDQEVAEAMTNQIRQVRELQREALEKKDLLTASTRTDYTRRIQALRPTFVAAAMEFVTRGLPLRETAFQSGYATMIFRDGDWDIPAEAQPPRRRGRGKAPAARQAGGS